MNTITPQELYERRRNGEAGELIDVRMPAEFREIHAVGARLVPLDRFDAKAIAESANGHPVYTICKSGSRARQAAEKLSAVGFTNVAYVEGGTEGWEKAGLPVERGRKAISLERQVRIGAGTLVLIGVILGWLVHPAFYLLPGFVGAGLLFAGITDFCGMAIVLAKMPWNRDAEVEAGCGSGMDAKQDSPAETSPAGR